MSYTAVYNSTFKKAYKRCVKRGLDMSLLERAVDILIEKGELPKEYRQHKLTGKFRRCWECHIQPDWLLIWEQHEDQLVLLFTDTGTHSDIFKK